MISALFRRITSPHNGHSLAAIDFSLVGPYGTSSPMKNGHTFRPSGGGILPALDAQHDESRCFDDEVIVDFPSVAPAVDRIRQAFLADERARPLEAAIQLSSRDALDGVTVPLSVPVRRTCAECGGRGGNWVDSCRRCEGSGNELVPHKLQVTVPAGVVDGTRVHFTVTPPHHHPTRIQLNIGVV